MFLKQIMKLFRRFFVTGLIVTIPLWVTILLIKAIESLVQDAMSIVPASFHPRTYIPFYGIELVIAILLIIMIGVVANNFLGKKFFRKGESLLGRIPIIKTVYQGVKLLTVGIFGDKKIFSRVVLLEYPIQGLHFIGFVTGEGVRGLPHNSESKMLRVFVPTTPNPTSGFFCFVPEEKVTDLNMSIDEAFKLIISAGYSDQNSD